VGRAARPPQPHDARLALPSAVLAGRGVTARLRNPELTPVEALWSSLKDAELANLAGDTLNDVITAAERGIQRIRDTHHLAYSFLRHCGLALW
jgi:hypothetical protein